MPQKYYSLIYFHGYQSLWTYGHEMFVDSEMFVDILICSVWYSFKE